jgi:hypothetical protein
MIELACLLYGNGRGNDVRRLPIIKTQNRNAAMPILMVRLMPEGNVSAANPRR